MICILWLYITHILDIVFKLFRKCYILTPFGACARAHTCVHVNIIMDYVYDNNFVYIERWYENFMLEKNKLSELFFDVPTQFNFFNFLSK